MLQWICERWSPAGGSISSVERQSQIFMLVTLGHCCPDIIQACVTVKLKERWWHCLALMSRAWKAKSPTRSDAWTSISQEVFRLVQFHRHNPKYQCLHPKNTSIIKLRRNLCRKFALVGEDHKRVQRKKSYESSELNWMANGRTTRLYCCQEPVLATDHVIFVDCAFQF